MFRLAALCLSAALVCSAQCVLTLQPNLPNGALNAAYPGLVVHGGAGPWTYSLATGVLPPGLSVSANGGAAIFPGIATTSGIYDFTLRVTDSAGCAGESSLRIVIGGELTAQPSAFPSARTGLAYNQGLGLAAGVLPVAMSGATVTSGALPPGLNITSAAGNWYLSGTPTTIGVYAFTLLMTTPTGQSASRAYSITVTAANTAITASPTAFRLSTRLSDPPLPVQRLDVAAADGGSYRYRVVSSNPGFRIDGAAGEFLSPFSLNPNIQLLSSTPGQFLGYIDIIPLEGNTPSTRIPVELIVQPPPTLLVSTSALGVSMRQNDPPVTRGIQLTSSDSSLSYTVETLTPIGGNWLTLTPAFGSTPASLNAVFNPVGLAPGTYLGTIKVNASRNGFPAIGSPYTISVTLQVDLPNAPGGFSIFPTSLAYTGTVNGPVPPAQTIRVENTAGPLSWSSSGSSPWISLSQITGTTPTDVLVTVIPNGLPAGTTSGSFTISTGNSSITVPVSVTLTDTPLPGDPLLRVRPDNIVGYVTTVSPTAAWSIAVDAAGPNYDVEFNPTVEWLTASPTNSRTPTNFNILADAGKLGPGTHKGAVIIVTTNPSGLKTSYPVNVTLYVSDPGTPTNPGALIPSNSTLFFDWRQGSSVPAPQTLILTSASLPQNWEATSTVNWLNLSHTAGTTPSQIEVSVSPQFLGAGNYRGEIRFRRGSQELGVVTVLLFVGGPGALRANPSALVYLVESGRDVAPQFFDLSRFDSDATANYTIRSAPEWLAVTPAAGRTPARLEAAIRRDRLPQATTAVIRMEGEITIESEAGGVRVPVLLTIVPPQGSPIGREAPWILSVTNAASTRPGPVAPGAHVTLYGGFEGRNVRVWFDSNAATLLDKQDTQLTVAAPFALEGRATTRVRVEVDSLTSRDLEIRVADTNPGIYTANRSGRGVALGLEEPVAPGAYVNIDLTGLGQTDPPGIDGARAAEGEEFRPLAPVEVRVGGLTAELIACQTPQARFHGAMRCQFRVPPGIEPGEYPLLVTAGGVPSQSGVLIRIHQP